MNSRTFSWHYPRSRTSLAFKVLKPLISGLNGGTFQMETEKAFQSVVLNFKILGFFLLNYPFDHLNTSPMGHYRRQENSQMTVS